MCVAEQNSRECFQVLCAQGSAGRSGEAPAQGPTALLYLAALLSVLSRSQSGPLLTRNPVLFICFVRGVTQTLRT